MPPRDHREEQSRPVRVPATPDGRGGWVPHLERVALEPGEFVELEIGAPDPREHTEFVQPGNVPRTVTTIRGRATRRV